MNIDELLQLLWQSGQLGEPPSERAKELLLRAKDTIKTEIAETTGVITYQDFLKEVIRKGSHGYLKFLKDNNLIDPNFVPRLLEILNNRQSLKQRDRQACKRILEMIQFDNLSVNEIVSGKWAENYLIDLAKDDRTIYLQNIISAKPLIINNPGYVKAIKAYYSNNFFSPYKVDSKLIEDMLKVIPYPTINHRDLSDILKVSVIFGHEKVTELIIDISQYKGFDIVNTPEFRDSIEYTVAKNNDNLLKKLLDLAKKYPITEDLDECLKYSFEESLRLGNANAIRIFASKYPELFIINDFNTTKRLADYLKMNILSGNKEFIGAILEGLSDDVICKFQPMHVCFFDIVRNINNEYASKLESSSGVEWIKYILERKPILLKTTNGEVALLKAIKLQKKDIIACMMGFYAPGFNIKKLNTEPIDRLNENDLRTLFEYGVIYGNKEAIKGVLGLKPDFDIEGSLGIILSTLQGMQNEGHRQVFCRLLALASIHPNSEKLLDLFFANTKSDVFKTLYIAGLRRDKPLDSPTHKLPPPAIPSALINHITNFSCTNVFTCDQIFRAYFELTMNNYSPNLTNNLFKHVIKLAKTFPDIYDHYKQLALKMLHPSKLHIPKEHIEAVLSMIKEDNTLPVGDRKISLELASKVKQYQKKNFPKSQEIHSPQL